MDNYQQIKEQFESRYRLVRDEASYYMIDHNNKRMRIIPGRMNPKSIMGDIYYTEIQGTTHTRKKFFKKYSIDPNKKSYYSLKDIKF